ncbi:hypothetical protein S2091_1951 [Solimicrobium silvestre]|uniref:Uncharacterized protein n=1 Tax=Solimicrobium silvestre TaxID=2099400 RepID=A0A2S9GZT8_9BURK|nr:hypothetical protein S2091_1951 [Solimicrobium silvestre]
MLFGLKKLFFADYLQIYFNFHGIKSGLIAVFTFVNRQLDIQNQSFMSKILPNRMVSSKMIHMVWAKISSLFCVGAQWCC